MKKWTIDIKEGSNMEKLTIRQKLFMVWVILLGLCMGITLGSYVKINNDNQNTVQNNK